MVNPVLAAHGDARAAQMALPAGRRPARDIAPQLHYSYRLRESGASAIGLRRRRRCAVPVRAAVDAGLSAEDLIACRAMRRAALPPSRAAAPQPLRVKDARGLLAVMLLLSSHAPATSCAPPGGRASRPEGGAAGAAACDASVVPAAPVVSGVAIGPQVALAQSASSSLVPTAAAVADPPPAWRDDPVAALQALHAHFGAAAVPLPRAASPRFSVHPVQPGRYDPAQWTALPGVAAPGGQDPAVRLWALQRAVQERTCELVGLWDGALLSRDAPAGFSLADALTRQLNPGQIRNAIASGLRARAAAGDAGRHLTPLQANWIAALLLCRYEPALGRIDAPSHLAYGSPQWAQRQLAIANCDASGRSHWTMRDVDLVATNRRFVGAAAMLDDVALRHGHAGGLLDLTAAAPEREAVAEAIGLLRIALAPEMTLPSSAAAPGALAPGWIERIDWTAFDGAGFLQRNGAPAPYRNTMTWWVTALHACFEIHPAANRSALHIDGMHGGKLRRFGDSVMRSQGYGAMAAAPSPAFLQTLFNDWFRFRVAPLAVASFQGLLGDLTRPAASGTCGKDAWLPPPLPPVHAVRNGLRRKLLAGCQPLCPPALERWAFASLCELFLPALARHDLPEDMAYGGIAWTLLDIATFMLGAAHWDYAPEELILFAYQTDIFAAAANSTAPSRNQAYAAAAMLRMAHGAGVVDARAAVGAAEVEQAFDLFRQRLAASGPGDPLADFAAAIPTRIDAARALLTEHGFPDPDRAFTMTSIFGRYFDTVIASPMEWGQPHPLSRIYLEQGLPQLAFYGDLSEQQSGRLAQHRAALTAAALNARFERDFDAAIASLTERILVPALRQAIQALPPKDQAFWQCGRWELRIPRAQIKTRRPWSGQGVWTAQAFNAYAMRYPDLDYSAEGALLVDLYGADGATRYYWVSLKPFRLARFDGDVASLLTQNLTTFFKPRGAGYQLLALSTWPKLSYLRIPGTGAPAGAPAAIAGRLLAPLIEPLRQAARGVTDSELFRRHATDFLLNLLPFYGCAAALKSSDEIDSAGMLCTLDMAGLMPVLGAGAKAVSGTVRIAAALSRQEVKRLAASFATRAVLREGAAGTLAATLNLARPWKHAAAQTISFLDPGIGPAWGMARLVAGLGKQGARALALKMKMVPGLRRMLEKLNRQRRQARFVFQDGGFWRARRAKVTHEGGERYLAFGGKRFPVMEIGGSPDVLVLREGDGVRLADPQNGLVYGPLLRPDGARLSSHPVENPADRRLPAALAPTRGIATSCRAKRSPGGGATRGCRLQPAAGFGAHFYQFEAGSVGVPIYQWRPASHRSASSSASMQAVDPASAAYSSYSYADGRKEAANLFVLDRRLWARDSSGAVSRTRWSVEFPDRLPAHFIHARAPHTEFARSYVQADFAVGQLGTERHFRNTYVVPYGSYAETDKTLMGMAEIGGEHYTFKTAEMPPPLAAPVTLVKASVRQRNLYHAYWYINNAVVEHVLVSRVTRLAGYAPDFRERVQRGLSRTAGMIADAKAFLALQPAAADAVLRNFVRSGVTAASAFRIRIAADLVRLEQAVAALTENRDLLLGFAKMSDGSADPVLALSVVNSMRYEIDPRLINKPLIYLDPDEVARCSADMLAAHLAHELTHTRLGTLDSMGTGVAEQVYVTSDADGHVDIADLIAAAQISGNDPGMHASTLENLLVLFAYRYRDEPGVAGIFDGRSTVYRRKPDPVPGSA